MANTVAIRNLISGSKKLVVHAYLASDGVAGELADQILVDVSALPFPASKLTLEKIDYALTGFSAFLEFDATTDQPLLGLLAETPVVHDFTCFGGIPDPLAVGTTGDILISTTGFTAAGDRGTIILQFKVN